MSWSPSPKNRFAVMNSAMDEDGNEVMGEEVIADVIEQGSQLAQERRDRQAFNQDVPDEEIITTTVHQDGGWRW